MADKDTKQVTERELREAELQMTGHPPTTATGFIGFVPATPASPNGAAGSATNSGSGDASSSSPADKQ
jgi:hypothetical protein